MWAADCKQLYTCCPCAAITWNLADTELLCDCHQLGQTVEQKTDLLVWLAVLMQPQCSTSNYLAGSEFKRNVIKAIVQDVTHSPWRVPTCDPWGRERGRTIHDHSKTAATLRQGAVTSHHIWKEFNRLCGAITGRQTVRVMQHLTVNQPPGYQARLEGHLKSERSICSVSGKRDFQLCCWTLSSVVSFVPFSFLPVFIFYLFSCHHKVTFKNKDPL